MASPARKSPDGGGADVEDGPLDDDEEEEREVEPGVEDIAVVP